LAARWPLIRARQGYAEETGDGPAVGTNLNLPLAPAITDEKHAAAFATAVEVGGRFGGE